MSLKNYKCFFTIQLEVVELHSNVWCPVRFFFDKTFKKIKIMPVKLQIKTYVVENDLFKQIFSFS